MNPVDMYGNIIEPGDFISYPVRTGSATYVRTAKVRGIRQKKNREDKVRSVLDVTVAIVPRWWERVGNWQEKIVLKKTTVFLPHRATVLPKSYVQKDPRYNKLMEVNV